MSAFSSLKLSFSLSVIHSASLLSALSSLSSLHCKVSLFVGSFFFPPSLSHTIKGTIRYELKPEHSCQVMSLHTYQLIPFPRCLSICHWDGGRQNCSSCNGQERAQEIRENFFFFQFNRNKRGKTDCEHWLTVGHFTFKQILFWGTDVLHLCLHHSFLQYFTQPRVFIRIF